MRDSSDVTGLIEQWQGGDESALEALTPFVYDELRRLAGAQMRGESNRHTLQATALVNEAFIKLSASRVDYASRKHFLNLAAGVMRRILVDHARTKQRLKRGGSIADLTLNDADVADGKFQPGILDLDLALDKLEAMDSKLAESVQLIYFGGLTYEEAADYFGVSRTKFYEDFQFAKAWLKKELE
ncbi:MAG: ECF-type sigma factor [Pseudomonadota bacterium]